MRESDSNCVCGVCMCRGRRGRGPLPKYNKMAGLDMKSRVKELFEILTVLHWGGKKKKEVSFENEATLQVKVGGLFVCLSHFVGGLEYCCTMVYLPFLLQYNLLKLSVNKTEFWYYRPAVSE